MAECCVCSFTGLRPLFANGILSWSFILLFSFMCVCVSLGNEKRKAPHLFNVIVLYSEACMKRIFQKLAFLFKLLVQQSCSVCCVYKWLTFLCTAASVSLKFDFCVLTHIAHRYVGKKYSWHIHKHFRVNSKSWFTYRCTCTQTHVWGKILKHLHPKCLLMHPNSLWQVNCNLVPQKKSQKHQEVEDQHLPLRLSPHQSKSLILCQRSLKCPMMSEMLFPPRSAVRFASDVAHIPHKCVPPLGRWGAKLLRITGSWLSWLDWSRRAFCHKALKL